MNADRHLREEGVIQFVPVDPIGVVVSDIKEEVQDYLSDEGTNQEMSSSSASSPGGASVNFDIAPQDNLQEEDEAEFEEGFRSEFEASGCLEDVGEEKGIHKPVPNEGNGRDGANKGRKRQINVCKMYGCNSHTETTLNKSPLLIDLPSFFGVPRTTSTGNSVLPTGQNNQVFQLGKNAAHSRNVSTEISSDKAEKEFQELVLQKLDNILLRLESVEERLKFSEDSNNSLPVEHNELSNVFPLKTLEEVKKCELLLKDTSHCNRVFLSLKETGGKQLMDLLSNLLKKVFSASQAAEYSWLGADGKRSLKSLALTKVLMRVVQLHFPSVSESEVVAAVTLLLKCYQTRSDATDRVIVKEFDVNRLSTWLRDQNIDENTIMYIREQEICGSAFMQLTETDIRKMKLRLGPAKLLAMAVRRAIALEGSEHLESIGAVTPSDKAASHPATSSSPVVLSPSRDVSLRAVSSARQAPLMCPRSPDTFSRYSTVRETLSLHPQGTELIAAAEKGGESFKVSHRRAIVRILVSELVKHFDSHYPPDEAKIKLAAQIVKEFPKLKDITDVTQEGYHHFYNATSRNGFIEYRLWTLRKSLPPTKRKYKTAGFGNMTSAVPPSTASDAPLLNVKHLEEKKTWMKLTDPTEVHKKDIVEALKDTLPNRRLWISTDHPTVSTIFGEYPRLVDFDGEMIELEFRRLQDVAAPNFLSRFGTFYVPRLLKIVAVERPDIIKRLDNADIHDDNLRALLVLCELMPPSNFRLRGQNKKARADDYWALENDIFPHPDLIVIIKEGHQVDARISERLQGNGANIKPFLLCLVKEDGAHYCVMADQRMMCLGPVKSVLRAFDLLFKLHYVCSITFPCTLSSFYNFIECFVYGVPNCKPKNFNTSLNVNLTHVEL